MSDYIKALSTFNSCNKAGSIPHFTKHLESHPDHYRTLMRRATAYAILGKATECIADLRRAVGVSSGAEKLLAEAELARATGNQEQYLPRLESIIDQYPEFAPGWSAIVFLFYCCNIYDRALQLLEKAVKTAKVSKQTDAPDYCWDNYYIGDIYLKARAYDEAEKYFKAAIESSSTLTVAYLGLSQVHLAKQNMREARECFETAKQLNANLVHWENFDAFRQDLEKTELDVRETESQMAQMKLKKDQSSSNKFASEGKGRSKEEKAKPKNSGGNDSGTSDDDDSSEESLWDKLKKEAPCKAKYRGRTIIQSKCGKFWYSKDTAGHGGARHEGGGAYVKVYRDKRNSLEFSHAADKNLKPIEGKHESRQNTVIQKNDLHNVVRKK